jgi:hypothetical protein
MECIKSTSNRKIPKNAGTLIAEQRRARASRGEIELTPKRSSLDSPSFQLGMSTAGRRRSGGGGDEAAAAAARELHLQRSVWREWRRIEKKPGMFLQDFHDRGRVSSATVASTRRPLIGWDQICSQNSSFGTTSPQFERIGTKMHMLDNFWDLQCN